MPDQLVQPTAPQPSAPPPVEPTDAAPDLPPEVEGTGDTAGLPDEILQIPVFQALVAGQPAAVSADIQSFDNRPEGDLIEKNKDRITQAGISFYRTQSGDKGVIFNHLYVSGDAIKQADAEGTLDQIAPPFDEVNQAVLEAGADNPVLTASGVPGGPAGEIPQPPQSGSPIPPTSGSPGPSQSRLTTARLNNIQSGQPSDGARPGQGRILNDILKTPV